MRTIPVVAALETLSEPRRISIDEGVRCLIGLVAEADCGLARNGAGHNAAEEILLDAVVDGARYLLVRMPLLDVERVQLSPREHEIVRMVASGHPNKVIADVLNISSWTVCTHMRRIFAKLGVGSRAAMVARLHSLGVVAAPVRSCTGMRREHTGTS